MKTSSYILLGALLIAFLHSDIFPKSVNVGTNFRIKSLGDALSILNDGDSLIVNEGLYKCNDLTIKNQITIIGNGNAVLDGDGKHQIMKICADNVTVKKILFQNSGISFIEDNAAIKLDSVKNCVVTDNVFSNNFFAIYVARTSSSIISNNTIVANNTRETYSGNGIHLWYSRDIIIENNFIKGHRDGIYLEFVRSSYIQNNVSNNNLRYGLHFMFSDSCSYSSNSFISNGAGVAVMFTRNVKMFNNKFENNWGGASYGILLKEIFDGDIYGNYFYKNSSGLYLEGCNRINVSDNDFVENGSAIRLMANSMDNIFTNNNFLGNSFDLTTNNIKNYNSFENNYWAEYKGYDLNKDGIGDVPFRPVKLFSLITEQNKPTLVLLRSLFVELLDMSEKFIPVLTPESLTDNTPMMRKISHDTNK